MPSQPQPQPQPQPRPQHPPSPEVNPDPIGGSAGVVVPDGWRLWLAGSRPRTLPAAVVPVLVGTAVAHAEGSSVVPWRAIAAMIVAVAIQVATNFANDYSDGVRGTDASSVRIGPLRLVGSGLVAPKKVKIAAFASFGVAGLAGGALALAVGPELFVVGSVSMAAGWFYTGGPRPYGYAGLGELFVFAFFGVVATAGSYYVQAEALGAAAFAASVPVGFLATAMLVVNNLRDIDGDLAVGKRTLAVKIGATNTRRLYSGLVLGSFISLSGLCAALGSFGPTVAVLSLPLAKSPVYSVSRGAGGTELIAVLADTGRFQLLFGLLLTLGVAFA